MGERPVPQPEFAGTLTPDPKRRLVHDLPTPQGFPRQFRPERGEVADVHVKKPPSAIDQALASERPLDSQLSKALENYEDYNRLARGTAKVSDLRETNH